MHLFSLLFFFYFEYFLSFFFYVPPFVIVITDLLTLLTCPGYMLSVIALYYFETSSSFFFPVSGTPLPLSFLWPRSSTTVRLLFSEVFVFSHRTISGVPHVCARTTFAAGWLTLGTSFYDLAVVSTRFLLLLVLGFLSRNRRGVFSLFFLSLGFLFDLKTIFPRSIPRAASGSQQRAPPRSELFFTALFLRALEQFRSSMCLILGTFPLSSVSGRTELSSLDAFFRLLTLLVPLVSTKEARFLGSLVAPLGLCYPVLVTINASFVFVRCPLSVLS